MRVSGELRKPQALYVAVNLDAIEDLPGSEQEKEAFNLAYGEERRAQEELLKKFNYPAVDDLPPEWKELVYAPLQVPLKDSDKMEELEHLTGEAMLGEIERLAEYEWSQYELTFEQMTALKLFKQRQWQTKKAYLMLTATELARREISPHTKSCEEILHKANVESHLEEVYANENAWFKKNMDGQLTSWKLNVTGFDREEVRENIRHNIIAAVSDELSTIPRRTSSANGEFSAVKEQISPEAISVKITECITRLKAEGIKAKPARELDELFYSSVAGEAGNTPSIRQVLVSQSTAAFKEALDRTDKVINGFYFIRREGHKQIKPIGLEQIIALRDELSRKAGLVAIGKEEGIEESIKTKETIEHHYQELMRAIHWVGFDATTMGGPGTECEESFNRVCDIMREVISIPENRKARANRVGQISWENDEKSKDPKIANTFLKKHPFTKAVQKRLVEEKKNGGARAAISGVFRLGWKEKPEERKGAKKSSRPPVSDSSIYKPISVALADAVQIKATAVTNSQSLQRAVHEAKNALERQQYSDEAMKLCQVPPKEKTKLDQANTEPDQASTTLYDECMDEILQQLLAWYKQYSDQVQEHSQREQRRIHKQAQLMQVPMGLAY